jgi:hypothetical protein
MRSLKKLIRVFRMLFFAFMLAACMVLGVAPVIPKRKEPFSIEIKMEEPNEQEIIDKNIDLFKKN